jgi:hypothetical protein
MDIKMRLCFRDEGNNVNCYVATPSTMEGAVFIGSIPRKFLKVNPAREKQFQDLMSGCFSDMVKDLGGEDVIYEGAYPAPDHEKSGSA